MWPLGGKSDIQRHNNIRNGFIPKHLKNKHGVLIISNKIVCYARSHTFERLFFGNKCVNCLAMFNIGPCIWDDSGMCCRTVNSISENIDLSPLLFMGRSQAIFELLLISNLLSEKNTTIRYSPIFLKGHGDLSRLKELKYLDLGPMLC